MHVIGHATLPRNLSQGRTRCCVASAALGLSTFELWMESLQPNAVAQVEPDDRDRVALVLVGHGDLRFDGASQRFRAPCSLLMPRDGQFEIVNVGAETLSMVLAVAPAGTGDAGPPPAGP